MPPETIQNHERCLYPERWAQLTAELNGLRQDMTATRDMVQDLHSRMFVDNGAPCHQTRIGTVEGKVAAIIWAVCATATTLAGVVVHALWSMVASHTK